MVEKAAFDFFLRNTTFFFVLINQLCFVFPMMFLPSKFVVVVQALLKSQASYPTRCNPRGQSLTEVYHYDLPLESAELVQAKPIVYLLRDCQLNVSFSHLVACLPKLFVRLRKILIPNITNLCITIDQYMYNDTSNLQDRVYLDKGVNVIIILL